MRSPNHGNGVNTLYGVSCVRPSFCMAVGSYYVNPTTDLTLAEAWDGRAWSIVPSPNEGSGDNLLMGVSCTSAVYCVAVGDAVDASNIQQTLVEVWNGHSWTIVPSPNEGGTSNDLNAVSCNGTTHCVAVGDYVGTPITGLNLIESWNGSSWSITSVPNQGGAVNGLFGVWCTSATSCRAVGFAKPAVPIESESLSQTLLESWDGSAWSITPTPDQASSNNDLYGVSCTSSSQCVAVGLYAPSPSSAPQNLVETWNGSLWDIVPSPNQGAGRTGLSSVSCTGSTACLAVGKNQELVNYRPSHHNKGAGRSRRARRTSRG